MHERGVGVKKAKDWQVTAINKDLRRAHATIHALIETGPKRLTVKASTLKEMAETFESLGKSFRSLATSPFLGFEVEPHLAVREPEVAPLAPQVPTPITVADGTRGMVRG